MTCVKSVAKNGALLWPMFIFLAIQHMKHWFNASLAEEVVFAVSESGYINDKNIFQWLCYFK